jgi:uracil-DNA glycosylase family 4
MAMSPSDRMKQALRQQLQSLEAAGVRQVPSANATFADPRRDDAGRSASQPAASGLFDEEDRLIEAEIESSAIPPVELAPTLEALAVQVAGCTRCGDLAPTRTQTVFGVGPSKARLCFLGEAPGADEDRLGEPFVGRAGQLLNKILEACKLRREDVYILNILKCRPPGNRNPLPDEAANCRPYLDRQLELIEPEFICCLGAIAAQNLLGTTESIGRLRGKVHNYRRMKVVCTYHPAYLLRNPAAKKQTWDDMKLLMHEMGMPVN